VPSAEEPDNGLAYQELQELGLPGMQRPLIGVLVLIVGFWLVLPVVIISLLCPHNPDGRPVTPTYLAATNLWWALAIPTVVGIAWWLHQQSPGWLLSVVGRFRWRWFAACLGLAFITLGITAWVSSVLPSQGSATVETSGHLNHWSAQMRDFLLVIVLLTPLQAAGEEFVFRGYLTQTFGGVADRLGERGRAAVAVVVPALLFGIAHGIGQDVPVFFDRFAFGLVAGTLVLVTGGLEAGIAMHVLNNFLAFGLALAYGDMTTTLHVTHGSWWSIPVTLVQSLLFLGLCWSASRRRRLARRTEGILAARTGAM